MIKSDRVISNEYVINAPVEQVWSVLTDFDRYGEWNPFTSKIQTTLEPGSPVRMHVHLKPEPKQAHFRVQTETVEWVKEGEELAWGIVDRPWLLRAQRTQRLKRLTDRQCSYQTWDIFSGLARPLVLKTMGVHMDRGFNAVGEALKKRCESTIAA